MCKNARGPVPQCLGLVVLVSARRIPPSAFGRTDRENMIEMTQDVLADSDGGRIQRSKGSRWPSSNI